MSHRHLIGYEQQAHISIPLPMEVLRGMQIREETGRHSGMGDQLALDMKPFQGFFSWGCAILKH